MDKFKIFLVKQGLDERTASDYASRCRRIEREMKVDLESETRAIESYVQLLKRIRAKYRPKTQVGQGVGRATSQLCGAVRRFAEYKWGEKVVSAYPYAYSSSFKKFN